MCVLDLNIHHRRLFISTFYFILRNNVHAYECPVWWWCWCWQKWSWCMAMSWGSAMSGSCTRPGLGWATSSRSLTVSLALALHTPPASLPPPCHRPRPLGTGLVSLLAGSVVQGAQGLWKRGENGMSFSRPWKSVKTEWGLWKFVNFVFRALGKNCQFIGQKLHSLRPNSSLNKKDCCAK